MRLSACRVKGLGVLVGLGFGAEGFLGWGLGLRCRVLGLLWLTRTIVFEGRTINPNMKS